MSEMEHDLIEACAQAGCPVCRLTEASVRHYLDSLLYEMVTDIQVRDRLRRSLGFCNVHAHQLLKMVGVSLGIGILYRDLVNTTLNHLEQVKFVPAREGTLSGAKRSRRATGLMPQAGCPACAQQTEKEEMLLTVLLNQLKHT